MHIMKKRPNYNKFHSGASLIEVLIALLVFSIGLQGIASLQYQAIKENFDSSQRSQAIWAAQELITRIQANEAGREAGGYTKNDFTADCDSAPDPYCADSALGDATECDASEMATFDVWETFCRSGSSPLNLTASISCVDAGCPAESDYQLTLQWSSKAVADDTQDMTDDEDEREALIQQQFIQVFRP
mgnify:CR=1 FL=1